MTEEREQQEDELVPFDEDPPVDPNEPRVGNSDAKFFGTRDDDEEEDEGEDPAA